MPYVIDDPDPEPVPGPFAWLVQYGGTSQVILAETIEQARLYARRLAGPHAPIRARLATPQEAA